MGDNKYLDILNELGKSDERRRNDHILIIDGLNALIRSFSAVNTINPKGYHVGGLTGFLKSMGSEMRQFNPTRIIVAWDGKGGAQNRKAMNSNYKAQREHASVIHWDIYDSKEEELQSLNDQRDRLFDYLDCLPVSFVRVDKLEADDIIAYMAQSAASRGHRVTVVSSDKDFLQLVSSDGNLNVYNPTKKILYDWETAKEFLGVIPENYNLVKSLLGDNSDNLDGVRGLGVKTIQKILPELCETPKDLQFIYDRCSEKLGTKKVFANIINDWDKVELNFKLMDLHETVLDEAERKIVAEKVKAPVPRLKTAQFLLLLEQDCIEGITKNTETWLSGFNYLQNF